MCFPVGSLLNTDHQERAIASMAPEALGAKAKGQFCVVVSRSLCIRKVTYS